MTRHLKFYRYLPTHYCINTYRILYLNYYLCIKIKLKSLIARMGSGVELARISSRRVVKQTEEVALVSVHQEQNDRYSNQQT